jgi:hypothetical protein
MNPQKRLFPCGQTRREFVWQMGGGFAGLALASLLESDKFFDKHAAAADTTNPLMARRPHLPSKVKSCIFLNQKDTKYTFPNLTFMNINIFC